MASDGGSSSAVAVATVFHCPEGERVKHNTPSTNFHLAADTTFFEILQAACTYYGANIADSVLRNGSGSIWPMKDTVANGLRYGGQVRLTPSDKGDEDAEEEKIVEEEEVEKDDVDDGRVIAARPPLVRELVLHTIFVIILVFDTYLGVGTQPDYKTHLALENAFINPRSSRAPLMTDPAMEAAENYLSIYTSRQMCTWLTNRLVDGLFETDLHDAWGDIQVYNRVAVRLPVPP